MTLRSKIALALAVVSALAVLLAGTAGYLAADARLRSEVDSTLSDTARRFLDLRTYRAFCVTPNSPRPGPGRDDEVSVEASVVQCVNADGSAGYGFGPSALPIDSTDRQLASSGKGSRTRTVVVDGTPYRIETLGLPGGLGAVQIARDYGETQRVLDGLRWQVLGIGVVVTALGALAGWLIARQATRPLVRLTDAAEEVAETGSFDVDLPRAGRDEPGRLSRAFAAMLAALRQSRDQQQQLVQDAGHELRTPLTSLRTNVESLQRYANLPPETRQAILRDLDSESRELAGLVDELVQLATDTREEEPEQAVDLADVAEKVAHRAERRTGHPVTVTTGAAPSIVVGRPRALMRAVGNLVDNATKFSPDGAPVEVAVDGGRVTVRDHGPGVAPADQPHVFDRFYRSPEARALPGSGLGLSIVDQIARAHGGSAAVANHPGGGAVFTLDVPVAP